MNGEGFRCDQCGKAVIVPVAPGHRPQQPSAPLKWFVLLGPTTTTDGAASVPALHLCSAKCVAAWSLATTATEEVTPS